MDIFQDAVTQIEKAANLYNADQKIIETICKGGEVIDLKFQAFTYKGKENFYGVRVHEASPWEPGGPNPHKGGMRYAKYPSIGEMIKTTRGLSLKMSLKNSLTDLPFPGAKGCLNIDPSALKPEELESITRELVVEMVSKNTLGADIDVPGPDMGTNEEVMKWMYLQHARLNAFLHRPNPAAVVTGKPLDFHGCPGRDDATARGGLIVLNLLATKDPVLKLKRQNLRFAIQGFGNVGENCCKLLSDDNFEEASGKIVAVTEQSSGLHNPKGMKYGELKKYFNEHKTFKGCALGDYISPEQIVDIECDVFITAAKENLIDAKEAEKLKAPTIEELGNSAITPAADAVFAKRNIYVIPDILGNPGGVVVSYLEWRKNRGDIAHHVDFAKDINTVHNELREILKDSVDDVLKAKNKFKTDLRTASLIVALQRLEHKFKRK